MKRLVSIVVVFMTLAILSAVSEYAVATPTPQDDQVLVAISDEDVRLFPNPVESELSVLCQKYDIERLMIFGGSGEIVFNSPMAIPQGSRMTINMSSHPMGYYTVKVWIKDAKQPLTYRILKK